MRFGEKWTLVAIALLNEGPRRFNQLKREITGVSQQMLTRTLRSLERDGLVERRVFPTTPPQVEYALTDLGYSLAERVRALHQWAMDNGEQINTAQATFDAAEARRAKG